MSRTILISAILLAMTSVLLTDNRANAQQPAAASRTLRFGEAVIQDVLDEPTECEFIQTPLRDVVDYLQDRHNLLMHIDMQALKDVGLTSNETITCNLRGIPLLSALRLMLKQLDLTWTIRADVLVITTEEEAENHLATKFYDVSDLVFPLCDQPYDGQGVPTTTEKKTQTTWASSSMRRSMGVLGGGMGMFNVGKVPLSDTVESQAQQGGHLSVRSSTTPQITRRDTGSGADMDNLIELIQDVVAPSTWSEVGGPGSIGGLGRLLVIEQTFDVHAKVENLLNTLRALNRAVPTVVVDARWVLLESESRDPVTLERLKSAEPGARGRIACMSGQLVHLTAGERRAVAVGAVPVVGSGIGYQPTIVFPNIGIVLEVRPTVASDRQTAVLDIRNIVTQWREPGPPIRVGGNASASVDRVRMPTQQFAATMRVPLGKPVLIGGMTLSPTEDGAKELYLVIETSIVGER